MRLARKYFIPLGAKIPALLGGVGLDFFLILGREGCEVSADKCEESQMLLVLGDARAGKFPWVATPKYWSLWYGICHNCPLVVTEGMWEFSWLNSAPHTPDEFLH